MTQRYLLRQSLLRTLTSRSILRTSLLAPPQHSPFRLPVSSISNRTTPKHYSTSPEAATGAEASLTQASAAEGENPVDDPSKKELETKNREIIDLKVWLLYRIFLLLGSRH